MKHSNASAIALCYGTRPQVVKASRLAAGLRSRWPVVAINTGQHYDYEMDSLLHRQLGLERPDIDLGVGSGQRAEQIAAVRTRLVPHLAALRPSCVVVIGDTNSTMGCAAAAADLGLPVIHVEAGLRCGDPTLPEEINRRAVDAIASLLCAPSASATEALARERAPGRAIRTGDVAYDVLLAALPAAERMDGTADSPVAHGEPYVFGTFHRAALTDDPAMLAAVTRALGTIPMRVVMPAHPRTRERLERFGLLSMLPSNVTLLPALGYLETIRLVRAAAAVATDSGGIQREAYWLGTPCVTVRGETEWVETMESGANRLVSPDAAVDTLKHAVAEAVGSARNWDRNHFGEGNAVDRVCDAIADTGLAG